MLYYTLRRISYLFIVMLGVSVMTFALSQLTPGDAAELALSGRGVDPTREAIEAVRLELGLDQPVHVQYVHWLGDVLRGDLGRSFQSGQPVFEEIAGRFPATLQLAAAGLLVMLCIALPAGILAATFKHTILDHLSRFLALVGASIPSFWLGLLLIYFFAVRYNIFPVMGRGSLSHIVLPALALGLGMSATYARLLRASLLEVLGQDHIRVARARGLTERLILVNNALRNALLPVVTAFGMSLGHLLGGTVIIETIFAWPGVGRFVVEAIFNRDYPVLQGYVLFMAIIFVLLNLAVDLSYRFFDPRIRLEGGDTASR